MKTSFKPIKPAIFLFLVILILLSAPCFAEKYKVIRVVDGDTIIIDHNGTKERIRLLRVNTPESVHRDKKQNIPMGKVASDYAKKRLTGKKVDLEFEGELRDRYERLLAYVFIDGENFCVELVKEGLSAYYTAYGYSMAYDHEFKEAERYARTNKLNIWGDPELTKKYLRLKSKWGMKRDE